MGNKSRSRTRAIIIMAVVGLLSVFTIMACDSGGGGSDTTTPEISNVVVSDITKTSAVITWNTNENADSKVVYGKTTSYGDEVTNASRVKQHSMAIVSLEAGTLYHYKVISSDKSGNETSSEDATFTTSNGTQDLDPPVISNIDTPQITDDSVTITWDTDEQATSRVYYGLTESYGLTASSSMLVTNHSLTLTGLATSTEYHFMISSSDSSGNTATSDDATFTTESPEDTDPPVISEITVEYVYTQSAYITWLTDEDATSRIDYGTTSAYGLTASSQMLMTVHGMALTDLVPDTEYHFKITSEDAFGNAASSNDNTFKTLSEVDITPPIISNADLIDISTDSATIIWETDEPATSIIWYGLTDIYGLTASSNLLTTTHSLTLTDLVPGTMHHYKILTADAYDNLAQTPDMTFTTLSDVDLTPPEISDIALEDIDSDSAVITWKTDEEATSIVLYGKTDAYGLTASSQMFVTNHSIRLEDLDSASEYHFRVRSTDPSGNTNLSEDQTFTTLSLTISYSADVQPLFNSNCTFCHGVNGGLSLAGYQDLLSGGNSGAVVVSGDPDSSLIIQKLENTSDSIHNGRLTESEIETIRNWIQGGILDN